ncbi:unnamed protein product [Caenorhabditis sp. 36 PRJEB53466]|nr:unnamed protein product [Caenorhabditis sp. 36 PRJEB53466]
MKNVLENLKLEQKKFGNITIANMEVFYEMCIDTTNCMDTIELPGLLKGLMSLGTVFLRSACDEYGFKVGKFSRCIEKTRFDVMTLKNVTIGQEKRKCELTNEEFSELETVVSNACGDEAVENMRANEERVRVLLCTDK